MEKNFKICQKIHDPFILLPSWKNRSLEPKKTSLEPTTKCIGEKEPSTDDKLSYRLNILLRFLNNIECFIHAKVTKYFFNARTPFVIDFGRTTGDHVIGGFPMVQVI